MSLEKALPSVNQRRLQKYEQKEFENASKKVLKTKRNEYVPSFVTVKLNFEN